tara:strand:- start:429 stop:986 length:558 start_codon:yes stop_codon:yes gene_type:complete
MKTRSGKRVNRLTRLRSLVEDLPDRDEQLKKDFQLFEDFFDNFPIPVTMWSITKDKTIVSQRGNGFACQKAKSLETMFLCPKIREISLERHALALKGEKIDYFVKTEEKVYYAKLVPRINGDNEIVGVSGIAWDVTGNAIMLSCIENIYDLTTGRRGDYKEIHSIVTRALKSSSLKDLLDSHEES